MELGNKTYFGCDWIFAKYLVGVRKFNQGLMYIIYSIVTSFIIVFIIYQNYKMVKNQVAKRFKFLYISNLLFIAYSISKIFNCLKGIAFCINGDEYNIIQITNFELFILPINVLNLSICDLLLVNCSAQLYLAKQELILMKRIFFIVIFPIIILNFILRILNLLLYQSKYLVYVNVSLENLFFSFTIFIFWHFRSIYRFLYEKSQRLQFLTSKRNFFVFSELIIFSLLGKLIWLEATIYQYFHFKKSVWYYDLSKNSFDSGSLSAILINIGQMFFTEMILILSVSFFLYYPTINTKTL